MTKLCIVFAAILAISHSTVVLPPACDTTDGGAGDSLQILTYVTNVTLAVTQLTPNQPYNLTAGCTYNVTFGFIPTSNTSVTTFSVVGRYTVNGVPHEQEIASTSIAPFSATTVETMLSFCTVLQVIQLVINCAVQTVAALLGKTILQALDCAGDTLANSIVANMPSQASATIMLEAPTGLSNSTVVFVGTVGDGTNVVACKQGIINIIEE